MPVDGITPGQAGMTGKGKLGVGNSPDETLGAHDQKGLLFCGCTADIGG